MSDAGTSLISSHLLSSSSLLPISQKNTNTTSTTSSHTNNAAETYAKLHPKEFLRKFLQHSVRPDGRSLASARPTTFSASPPSSSSSPSSSSPSVSAPTCSLLSTANACSFVSLGHTQVLAGITLQVGKPTEQQPTDGWFSVEVHLSPVCSSSYRGGGGNRAALEECISLSQSIQDLLRTSGIVALDDLCILNGQAAWVIYIDLVVIAHDGNLTDACILAASQALQQVRLPETELDEEGEVYASTVQFKPLVAHRQLVPLTFGMIDQYLIADPNAAEEDLLQGTFTMIVDGVTGRFLQCHKAGGLELSEDVFQQALMITAQRYQDLSKNRQLMNQKKEINQKQQQQQKRK